MIHKDDDKKEFKNNNNMLYYSANERLNDDVDMAHKIPAYYGEGEKRREKKLETMVVVWIFYECVCKHQD